MAPISRVSAQDAGQEVEFTYRYTRQGLAERTGRETDSVIEPLELCAHVPGLLRGYATLEQATAELDRVDKRLRALAQLITLEKMRGRLNRALDVGAASFSEGMVCAAPAFIEPPTNGNLGVPSDAAATL
jgi:hypothetical protein